MKHNEVRLVSIDTARLAIEKGFNYDVKNVFYIRPERWLVEPIAVPELEILIRWLEKKHFVAIVPFLNEYENWCWGITPMKGISEELKVKIPISGCYGSCRECALETGAVEVLKLLPDAKREKI